MSFRSARLETLLGGRVDLLRADDIRALVGSDVAESVDLDYKRDLYGGSDAGKRSLATDVAALANTSGGVILLGVQEDSHARPVAAPGVELSDAEQLRMSQIVASLVMPVPRFQVLAVPDGANPATGFYVISVERTAAAPHAVQVGDGLRFPRRNGASTRYLSEPEVAEAYRARLSGLADQQARLTDLWARGVAALDVTDCAWVALAAVPEVRGALRLDKAAYLAFQQRVRTRLPTVIPMGFEASRTFVGRDHFAADGSHREEEDLSRWFRLEVHADGSVFFAVAVGRALRGPGGLELEDVTVQVDDEHLVLGVLSGLLAAGVHARDLAGSSGLAALRASLVGLSRSRPAILGHSRGFLGDRWGGSRTLRNDPDPVDTVADLDDIAAPSTTLVATAASVCDRLVQSFGVPECAQLSSDGKLRIRYFAQDWAQRLRHWGNEAGIAVTDEVLPQG